MNSVEQIASGYGNFSYERERTASETGDGTDFAQHIGQASEGRIATEKRDRHHSEEQKNILSIDNVDQIVYNMWGQARHTAKTRGELMNIVT